MKKQLAIVGLFIVIILSGCFDSNGEYFEEIVKVTEVKTETTDNGLIRYYFKCNSNITDEWINAKSKGGFIGRWFVVSINDTIELTWWLGSNGIILYDIDWISKGEQV